MVINPPHDRTCHFSSQGRFVIESGARFSWKLQAIEEFLQDHEYADLQSKYELGDAEWEALDAFKRILAVSF